MFSTPIKGRAQCYASSHSDFHEHLWSHDACKRAMGKVTLHRLPINNEYICLCWVSTLFCMIWCLFSNCSKSCTKRLRSLYITFNLHCEYSTFPCARPPCIASRSAFYRGREHLWIVFSFNLDLQTMIFPPQCQIQSYLLWSLSCNKRKNQWTERLSDRQTDRQTDSINVFPDLLSQEIHTKY